jgi:hypothetical protein
MTEAMVVEAVRGVAASNPVAGTGMETVGAAQSVADPSSVARFEAAMAIPFASEAAAAWRTAQVNRQGLLHRIRALAEMRGSHSLSAPEMVELQYDVANLAFQQEVVTKVADKSSSAIQTLIKNQ